MAENFDVVRVLKPDEYFRLVDISNLNDLEAPTEDDIAKIQVAWGVFVNDLLVGSIALLRKENCWIVDCLAVDESLRGKNFGRQLVEQAENYVRNTGPAQSIFLVTKVPGFFGKLGYRQLSRDEAPDFSECFTCQRYQVQCFPQVMTKEL